MPPTVVEPASGAAPAAAIARSAFHLVVGQVATTALAVVLSAALGRGLGAADFGLFFLLTTTVTFAWVLAEWGQGQYLVREVARAPERAGVLAGAALALRLAGALPVAALVLAAAWLLGHPGRTLRLLALTLAATVPFFLSQVLTTTFRARERMDLDAQVSVVHKALALVGAVGALALGAGLAGVVSAQGAAGLAALGFAAWRGRGLGLPRLEVTAAACRELLREGLPILAIGVAVAVQPYLDALVLARLLPPEPVGWYGAARTVMGTLVAPATILGAAAYPRLSRAAGDAAALRSELGAALRPLLWLGALGAAGTWRFADLAVGLIYGARGFGPAAAILELFAPVLLLLCLDVLLTSAVLAVGRPKALAAAKAANVAACTGLSLLLIPWCQAHLGNGGLGLVAAFGASEVIMFVAAVRLLPRGVLGRPFAADVARAVGAALAALAVTALPPSLPPWAGVPLCVAAFSVAAAALGLVGPGELRGLAAAVGRRPRPQGAQLGRGGGP